MQDASSYLKKAAAAALVLMGVLLLGAIIFFRERMFSDAAYIVFRIINSQSFQIQESRYGSFITQLFPLLGAWLHLPVKAILIGYSASFNVFYLGVALVLFCRFKAYGLVVLMGLYYTLYFSDAYFWTNCELHQGVGWMFLAFGALRYYCSKAEEVKKIRNRSIGIVLFLLAGSLAISSHPEAIVLFLFLWGFFWLVQDSAPFTKKYSIGLFAFIIIACAARYLRSTQSYYDGRLMAGLQKATLADIAGTFTGVLADTFWQNLLHNHWLPPLLLLAAIIVLIKQRKFLLLGYVLLANVAFFVLVCLTFKSLYSYFYFESELMPFGILAGAAFVWYVLPAFKKPGAVLAVVTIIFATRLIYIGAAAPRFIARAQKVDTILACMKTRGIKKLMIPCGDGRAADELILYWGLCYESLLYSKMAGEAIPATAMCADNGAVPKDVAAIPKTTFYGPWERLDARDMRPDLRIDTVQVYILASYEEALCK